MPNPNINWGGAQAVLCNVVAAFGVDNTGATDAGPDLAIAFASLSASGQTPWLRSGTYEVTTAAPPAVGQPVWVQPGVTFTGANAASVANVALVYGQVPGTPAYNPAWYALTDVYLDPVAGSDTNSGAIGAPVKTMAEVLRRYGSQTPAIPFGQSLTLHQVTPQAINVDVFYFAPQMTGGGNYVYIGTPAAVGAPFSPGVVTAKVQTAVGNDLEMSGGLPGGILPGQIIFNSTKNSYALVNAVAGGVATITQPVAAAGITTVVVFPVLVEDNTWANTDTYQLSQPALCNMKNLVGTDGDVNAASTTGIYWLQGIHIADASGTVGLSGILVNPRGNSIILSLCVVDPLVYFSHQSVVLSCQMNGVVYMDSGAGVQAGAMNGAVFVGGNKCSILVDCIVGGTLQSYAANLFLKSVHLVGAVIINGPTAIQSSGDLVWGAATINVAQGGSLSNNTGQTWATCLKVATLQLDGGASGYAFNDTAIGNPFAKVGAITSAALDTGGGGGNPGLQNPRTGSKYAST